MFSSTSGVQDTPDLIPSGTLAFAILVPKEIKTGKESGAQYVNVELRLSGGTFEKRRIFEMINDPFDPNASEGGKRMGILAVTRICEAVGIFNPENEDSYNRYSFEGCTIEHVLEDIENQTVAIKTKVEKGTDGHADKPRVAEWLTPNPRSKSGYEGWRALKEGKERLDDKPVGGGKPATRPAFGSGNRPGSPPPRPGVQKPWFVGPNGSAPGNAPDSAEEPDDVPF